LRFMAPAHNMRDHDVGALYGALYRTKCSCINLDYFMQMHLVI
jgi:hypothetical protein